MRKVLDFLAAFVTADFLSIASEVYNCVIFILCTVGWPPRLEIYIINVSSLVALVQQHINLSLYERDLSLMCVLKKPLLKDCYLLKKKVVFCMLSVINLRF